MCFSANKERIWKEYIKALILFKKGELLQNIMHIHLDTKCKIYSKTSFFLWKKERFTDKSAICTEHVCKMKSCLPYAIYGTLFRPFVAISKNWLRST